MNKKIHKILTCKTSEKFIKYISGLGHRSRCVQLARDPASFVSVRFAHNETSVRLSRPCPSINTKGQTEVWPFVLMRAVVDAVRTSIMENKGYIYIPDLQDSTPR